MEKLIFSNEQLADLARWLIVLGEPNRLLLLEKIIEGVQCTCELGDALQMAPSLVSHHLRVLREACLVEIERDPIDSRWIYYSINLKKVEELKQILGVFFDQERIQPRRLLFGPQGMIDYRLSRLKLGG